MRWLLTFVCLSFATLALGNVTSTLDGKQVDKVLVLKSEHRLHLISKGETLKSYRISLGKKPTGPKIQEGDKRTPEGFYWIDWRKPSGRYNLAMHISYPNARDKDRASELKVKPGGMIMLHGTPIDEEYPEWYFNSLDWTEGCIALTNDDMREIWTLVKDGTLIEIRP
ncbi:MULTISPECIES: murein L,D-transpeptidase family protein [Pseudomonas]|uniref:L,D-transpeptidase family protein n=1 Tax=Pseudomonas TaxID=286 RepID=UPI00249AE6ED|nr:MULTISPECIES: L,D-transpeptidase family protein [Pseudomonas]